MKYSCRPLRRRDRRRRRCRNRRSRRPTPSRSSVHWIDHRLARLRTSAAAFQRRRHEERLFCTTRIVASFSAFRLHLRGFGRHHVLLVLHHGHDVRDVELGIAVLVQIGRADVHRRMTEVGADLRRDVFERAVAAIAVVGVDAEVVADDEIGQPSLSKSMLTAACVQPVFSVPLFGTSLKAKPPALLQQFVRRRIRVHAREVRSRRPHVVAVVADVEIEQAVAIEIGRRRSDRRPGRRRRGPPSR